MKSTYYMCVSHKQVSCFINLVQKLWVALVENIVCLNLFLRDTRLPELSLNVVFKDKLHDDTFSMMVVLIANVVNTMLLNVFCMQPTYENKCSLVFHLTVCSALFSSTMCLQIE